MIALQKLNSSPLEAVDLRLAKPGRQHNSI